MNKTVSNLFYAIWFRFKFNKINQVNKTPRSIVYDNLVPIKWSSFRIIYFLVISLLNFAVDNNKNYQQQIKIFKKKTFLLKIPKNDEENI